MLALTSTFSHLRLSYNDNGIVYFINPDKNKQQWGVYAEEWIKFSIIIEPEQIVFTVRSYEPHYIEKKEEAYIFTHIVLGSPGVKGCIYNLHILEGIYPGKDYPGPAYSFFRDQKPFLFSPHTLSDGRIYDRVSHRVIVEEAVSTEIWPEWPIMPPIQWQPDYLIDIERRDCKHTVLSLKESIILPLPKLEVISEWTIRLWIKGYNFKYGSETIFSVDRMSFSRQGAFLNFGACSVTYSLSQSLSE